MSSLWKCVITFVITAILASAAWFFVMHMRTEKITEEFEGEIAQLTATLDALGPAVECYTVSEEFVYHYDYDTTGQVLTENSLQPITIPSSLVGEAYVTDTSQIIGKYCKVNIVPGTPITQDLLMSEWFDDTLRDVDITVNSRVVGMRVGDYVDIRMTLPFGEDYIIFPHKRIQYIGDRSIKVYLNESEWQTWQSATVDYYLNSAYGCRLYLTKYIEPGVQQPATAYYAASSRVYEIMKKDPNIVATAQQALARASVNRNSIDAILNEFITENTTTQTQGGLISGGRTSWSSDVMTDYRTQEQEAEAAAANDEEDTYVEEDITIDLNGAPGDEAVDDTPAGNTGGGQMEFETEPQGVQDAVNDLPGGEGETEATTQAETQGEEAPLGVETETTVAPEFESQSPIEAPEEGIEDPDFVG